MAPVFLTVADLSSAGTHVAYGVMWVKAGADHHELWIAALSRLDDPLLVEVPGPVASLAWSPRADVLAVAVPIDGATQIALVGLDGSWQQLTTTRRGVAGPFQWSPDGTALAVAVVQDEPSTVERAVTAMDGMGSLGDHASDIHLIDVGTGTTTRLTDGPALDRAPMFDTSGERIVFARSFEPEATVPTERPLLVDRDGVINEMPWTASATSTMAPTADGRMILASSRQSDRTRGVPASLYVLGPDGNMTDRTAGLDLHVLLAPYGDQPSMIEIPQRFIGLHADDAIVGISRQGSAHVVRVDLTGPIGASTVLGGARGCHPLALRGDQLLFAESTMERPPALRLVDLISGAETTVVEPNPPGPTTPLEVLDLPVVSSGDPIQAWFLRSSNAATTPLATVLIVHGGPYDAFGYTYHEEAHLLAQAGYGVVMANPHGSVGYGPEFATSIFGRPGELELDDLLAAVDRAVELGLADPDRLAVCGLSYGGYMSAHLAARTDRFRAAVIENPMIDLPSFRTTSDIGADLLDEMMQARPDEMPDRWRDSSPLHYAGQCRTPSLLVLGDADLRCPPSQGEQFHRALRAAGCPTDLVWLPGASHEGSVLGELDIRTIQNEALLAWIERYNPA